MKKLKAAVIGVGYLGNFHAQKYKNSQLVELVGVCDAYPEQANKIAAQLGVTAYTNPKDLIGKVDLVTIAASTTFHYELAQLFLSAGIAVNVEKPMTATLEQAEKLYELHQKTKTYLTVGHIERFNPAIIELKKEINHSALSFELTRWATFKARGSDVSVIYDLMIHDLDLVFWLTGSEVNEFYISGSSLASSQIDSVNAFFEMKNKQKLYVSVSRVSSKMQRSIKAYSEKQIVFANTGSLELEKQFKNSNPTNPDDLVTNQVWSVNKVDALQEETNHFINCVLGNEKPKITAEDGLKAMIWADKIEKLLVKK